MPLPQKTAGKAQELSEGAQVLEALWTGGLKKEEAEHQFRVNAGRQVTPGSPAKAKGAYGAWYMPAGEWRTVYGGSAEDNEALLRKMGAVSLSEIEGRHVLEQKRSELQDELSMTYTVKAYRDYMRERSLPEPLVMVRVPTASDQERMQKIARRRESNAHATRHVVGVEAQQQGEKKEQFKLDPFVNLGAAWTRQTVDNLRPADLDIDEVIAPEMRDMVRRTIAMNDAIDHHARVVAQLEKKRAAKDAQWASVLRAKERAARKAEREARARARAAAQASGGSKALWGAAAAAPDNGDGWHPRSQTPPQPGARFPTQSLSSPSAFLTLEIAPSGASDDPAFEAAATAVGSSSRGAKAESPSKAQHGGGSSRPATQGGSSKLQQQVKTSGDGPEAGFGEVEVREEAAAAAALAASWGAPRVGTSGGGAAAATPPAEVLVLLPSLSLELLAERSDVPWGVRALAQAAAAPAPPASPACRVSSSSAAGPPSPLSPAARRQPALPPGSPNSGLRASERGGNGGEGSGRRWLPERVPTLHSAVAAATSPAAPQPMQQQPALHPSAAPTAPTRDANDSASASQHARPQTSPALRPTFLSEQSPVRSPFTVHIARADGITLERPIATASASSAVSWSAPQVVDGGESWDEAWGGPENLCASHAGASVSSSGRATSCSQYARPYRQSGVGVPPQPDEGPEQQQGGGGGDDDGDQEQDEAARNLSLAWLARERTRRALDQPVSRGGSDVQQQRFARLSTPDLDGSRSRSASRCWQPQASSRPGSQQPPSPLPSRPSTQQHFVARPGSRLQTPTTAGGYGSHSLFPTSPAQVGRPINRRRSSVDNELMKLMMAQGSPHASYL